MKTYALITHERPGETVAWHQGSAITAARFLADVRQMARALPGGHHVLNACSDRYRFAVGFAAALLAGKVSLLPSSLTPEMVRQVKVFAPDTVCLTDHPMAIELPQMGWDDLVDASELPPTDPEPHGYEVPQFPADQTAAIVFTSGSTGLPVAHSKTWGALAQCVRAEAQRLGLLDGRQHSIVATVAPQHMYGLESSVLLALQSGAALSASHPFYPADICSALTQTTRPRLLVTTPIHLKVLLASGLDIPGADLVVSATAPLTPQLAQAVEDRLETQLLEIYGSTETGQVASRRTTATAEWTLFPGVSLQSEGGSTWALGGHVEQATPLADELEILTPQQFLLYGRTADLINIAGKRSSLGYLNHQLNAIPGVEDGAFFMPQDHDAQGGDVTRLTAFVVAPGLTQPELLSALRQRIDTLFIPRPLVFVESLPRNVNGKLPREALAILAVEHQRRGPDHAK